MLQPLKVLFLCTGNACRSQMAEGWAHHMRGDAVAAFSAGVEPHGLNPLAAFIATLPGSLQAGSSQGATP